jgi:tetratricopeptide (TPR) repeat protein
MAYRLLHPAKLAGWGEVSGTHFMARLFVALSVIVSGAGRALASPLFTSPPHFVGDEDRRQVVFFLNEGVHGALAVRAPDGSIEVIVPGSSVDATVRGERFSGDEARVAGVVLASAPHGATSIRIDPLDPVGEVSARALDDPPRLVVDLLAGSEKPDEAERSRPKPAATRVPARTAPARSPRPSQTASPRSKSSAASAPTAAPTAMPTVSQTARPSIAPTVRKGGVRLGDALLAEKHPPAAAGAAPTPNPPLLPAVAGDVPPMPCLWQRRAGTPFCAPDARGDAYGDEASAALARALATPGEAPPAIDLSAEHPARPYLEADRIYVGRAPDGKLLPAVRAYAAALRLAPDSPEAGRARMNVALALRAMAFDAELRAAAKVAAPGEAGLLHGLVGDLAVDLGGLDRARADFRAAEKAGGIGTCFAARGGIAVALEREETEGARAGLAHLAQRCPPAMLADAETELLIARSKLAANDVDGAHALLDGLRERVAPPTRARVMLTSAAVAERMGQDEKARRLYEELATGTFGARAASRAVARLALLDAAGGDLDAGIRRLGRLDGPGAGDARRTLVSQALAERKTAAESIALLEEAGMTAQDLAPADQVHVARSYRVLGFHAEAGHVLENVRRTLGPQAPTEVWEEAAELARDRGGWPGVLTLTDEWLHARPEDGTARALRARAFAAMGRRADAMAELVLAAGGLDPVAVRDLRIEVAALVRPHDLATALQLLQAADAASDVPALPAPRAAALLWELGDVAEASGDVDAAREAFGTLARRYPDEPDAELAAYREARLAAGEEAVALYEDAATRGDALARRAAEAAREYEDLVGSLGRGARR